MPISDEAYAALEDIVGKENVSRNPAVMDSYAFQWLAELVRPELSHFMPRPVAVVMPGSTEEVQAIVRLANKYKIKVKPHSTGWYHWAAPMYDDKDTMQLDMRRMNAIEIDEKNGIAIVEPYVIHAQLHAEAIKRGWTCNIIGAGCSCSVVAAACAYMGMGPGAYYMGGHAENVLGMEWVTPSGEIVRSGSLGSGDGWFNSEGPGPSVRGVMRGALGQRGGLGVFTKCAVKLVHWSGRTDWPVTGTVPAYRLPVDETMRAYTLAAPTWDAWADLYYKIYDNELGFIFHRQFNLAGADLAPAFWLMYNDPTKKLSDVPAMVNEPGMAGAHRGDAHLLPDRAGRPLQGRHRTPGPDPGRHPRRDRLLEGRALLREGHGGVHQRLPQPPGPQAHQLRVGGRLHRQLDADRHAGLGQGLHPHGHRRPGARRGRRATWCSAAATP